MLVCKLEFAFALEVHEHIIESVLDLDVCGE
jgi:hypothetical protein